MRHAFESGNPITWWKKDNNDMKFRGDIESELYFPSGKFSGEKPISRWYFFFSESLEIYFSNTPLTL